MTRTSTTMSLVVLAGAAIAGGCAQPTSPVNFNDQAQPATQEFGGNQAFNNNAQFNSQPNSQFNSQNGFESGNGLGAWACAVCDALAPNPGSLSPRG